MILEDTRGPNDEIAKLLRKHVAVESTALSCGDYAWYDLDGKAVGVERKTVSDLLSSISDGRLGSEALMSTGEPKDELVRMKSAYEFPILLVEGFMLSEFNKTITVNDIGRINFATFNGFQRRNVQFRTSAWATGRIVKLLYTYSRYLGIELLFTGNPEMSAHMLLQGYFTDQESSHGLERETRRFKDSSLTERQITFMTLPGIGPELAKRLDTEVGSLVNLCKTSEAELVKLLGPKRGRKVYKWLRE